jgi:hypothetical protein
LRQPLDWQCGVLYESTTDTLEEALRKTMTALLGIGVTVALLGTTAVASASARTTAGHHDAATLTAGRQFTATHTVDEPDTKQTVSGTYKNAKGRPFDVTVLNWQDIAQITTAEPTLDKAWDGGYWHRTYGLDQWLLGTADGDTYHLMLPPAPMGSTFKCLLVTEFGSGGNLQNWMHGTSR